MNKGKIFSIEEFSVFDGDGIRTSVFLKGCPLKCSWCHSPEGQSFHTEYLRSPNGCIGCNECLKAGNGKLTKDSVSACPRNLVRECGKDYFLEYESNSLFSKNDEFFSRSIVISFAF